MFSNEKHKVKLLSVNDEKRINSDGFLIIDAKGTVITVEPTGNSRQQGISQTIKSFLAPIIVPMAIDLKEVAGEISKYPPVEASVRNLHEDQPQFEEVVDLSLPKNPTLDEVEIASVDEILQSLALEPTWFGTSGKAQALIGFNSPGDRNHIDFDDYYYSRNPRSTELVVDSYGNQLSKVAYDQKLSAIYSLGASKYYYPAPSESTIRYEPITYENGSDGLVLIISLVHDKHPYDHRWHNRYDFFSFDLPLENAKQLLEIFLKDPSQIKRYLEFLTKQNSSMFTSYHEVTSISMSLQPGFNSMRLNKPETNRITDNFLGDRIFSVGSSLLVKKGDVTTELPVADALLDVNFDNNTRLELNREQYVQDFERAHELPAEFTARLRSATTLKKLITVVDDYQHLEKAKEINRSITQYLLTVGRHYDNHNASTEFNPIDLLTEEYGIRKNLADSLNGYVKTISELIKAKTTQEIIEKLINLDGLTIYLSRWVDSNQAVTEIKQVLSLGNNFDAILEYVNDANGGSSQYKYPAIQGLAAADVDVDIFLLLDLYQQLGFFEKRKLKEILKKRSRGYLRNRLHKYRDSMPDLIDALAK